jgi:hypothetical protein
MGQLSEVRAPRGRPVARRIDRRRMLAGVVALVVVASALGLVARSLIVGPAAARTPLAGDPAGAQACGIVEQWLSQGRLEHEFEVAKRAAVPAGQSTSPPIRQSASGVADTLRSDGTCCDGFAFVDLRRLYGACVAAGVDMSPY